MSKYVYEQFVTPDQREKMTNDASGVRKTYFAAGKLDPLTPEKRLNTLYSAIRDVEGDETHPIVKALKNYMLSNGSTQEQIDDILKQETAAYEDSKEQPKAKVEKGISVPLDLAEPFSPLGVPTKVNSPELQAPVVSKPQPGEKGFTYQRVELFHQFEGNLLTTYIKVNPSGYARDLLSEKTRDEQANILYSAQRGGDSNVINALEKHLINEKVFSPEQIESIKRAANQAELTISREQNEITAAVERGVSPIIKNSEGRNPAELPLVPFNVDNPEKSLVLASKLEKGKKLTFDEVLSKTGVVLSSSDQVLITEAFHKVGIMDIASKRNELLSEQITLTVATVVKNNPKLQPFVTEICDAFVDKATQDATRTALNGKFDPLKLQYQQQKKKEIEEELPSPDTRPRSNALTGRNDARAPKVEEIEAQDSIISVSTTEKGPSKVKVLSSSEV
jgi:flagella basal body P-ring formation protein FlgA